MAQGSNTQVSTDQTQNDVQPAASVSRFVEAGGVRLHYLDYGTQGRPPMLCMHGGAAHAHWFDFVAAGFSADYHVRALDLRGHGDSAWAQDYTYAHYASDMAEAVEKLGLRDFVLVGHSMGGMASLVYAATYPGRVSRLIIIDSTLKISEAFITDSHQRGTRKGSAYATLDDFIARFRLRPQGTNAAPGILRHMAANSARQVDGSWMHKFDRSVYARRKFIDSMACWDKIRIPALLIKAGLSERISREIVAEVQARAPQVEVAEVGDSHHHVTLDNPSGLMAAVRAFLARHP